MPITNPAENDRQALLGQLVAYFADWKVEGAGDTSVAGAIEQHFDTLFPDPYDVRETLSLFDAPGDNEIKTTVLKNVVSKSFVAAQGSVQIGDNKTVVLQIAHPTQLTKNRTIRKPPRTSYLLQRRQVLAEIKIQLEKHGILALTGQSGIGKTVLAEFFFQTYDNDYDYMMWIPYESDLPISWIRHRDANTIPVEDIIAEGKLLELPEPEIRHRCAEKISKSWSDLPGRKLLVLDGVAAAAELLPFRHLLDIADCHVLVTARTAADWPFAQFQSPRLNDEDIDALAAALSEAEHWDKNDLAHIAANTLLLDLTLRQCPRDNPQRSAEYIKELHPICQTEDWPTRLTRWLMDKANLTAGHRWVLLQWAALPDSAAIEFDTFLRIIDLEDKTIFYAQDFLFFKAQADSGRFRLDADPYEQVERYHDDLVQGGWLAQDEDEMCTLHPFLRAHLVATYGIAWDYICGQTKSLETLFFIREEVGYDAPDDDQTLKCRLIYAEHLAHFLHIAQAENTEEYRSLVSKHIAVLQANYDMPTLEVWLEKQLSLWEQANGEGARGTCVKRNDLALFYLNTANYDKALSLFEQNLIFLQQISDRQGEGVTLGNIGSIRKARGDYDKALGYFEQALIILQQIGDRKGEGAILNNISQICNAKGDYDTALGYLEQSLAIKQQIGDRKGEGTALNNIGQIRNTKGDYDTALGYFEQSLAIKLQIGDREGEGTALSNIGLLHQKKGDYDTALRYFEQSLAIKLQIGDRRGEGATLNNLGGVASAKSDYDTAMVYFEQNLAISQQIGDRKGEWVTLNNISQIFVAKGDYDTAFVYLKQSLAISQQIGDREGEGTTLHNIGALFFDQERYEEALPLWIQAYAIFEQIGSPVALNTGEKLETIKERIGEARYQEVVAGLVGE